MHVMMHAVEGIGRAEAGFADQIFAFIDRALKKRSIMHFNLIHVVSNFVIHEMVGII